MAYQNVTHSLENVMLAAPFHTLAMQYALPQNILPEKAHR